MPVSDSQTMLFTKIPNAIEKTWYLKTMNLRTGVEATTKAGKHSEAMITAVRLHVEFNNVFNDTLETYDESFDDGEDRIDIWQTVRKRFAELEDAVRETVKSQMITDLQQAKSGNMSTIDVLTRCVTTPLNNTPISTIPASTAIDPRRSAHEYSSYNDTTDVGSRVQTIIPSDSASTVKRSGTSSHAAKERRNTYYVKRERR